MENYRKKEFSKLWKGKDNYKKDIETFRKFLGRG